jgi:arylformamidase
MGKSIERGIQFQNSQRIFLIQTNFMSIKVFIFTRMDIQISYAGRNFIIDLSRPHDISLPLVPNEVRQVNCFFAPLFEAEPVRAGTFIGSVKEGGPVNFFNLRLNPHGNGTHTECVGHISKEPFTLPACLTHFHMVAKLVSILPQRMDDGDRVITKSQVEEVFEMGEVKALIIRTLPNEEDKKTRHYSGHNPPYVDHRALELLAESGIEHLLIDLPSVDREEDGGLLQGHKAYWNYPDSPRTNATITELIFVPSSLPDGFYFLNLQVTAMEIDVSPARPILYSMNSIE